MGRASSRRSEIGSPVISATRRPSRGRRDAEEVAAADVAGAGAGGSAEAGQPAMHVVIHDGVAHDLMRYRPNAVAADIERHAADPAR